MTALAFSQDFLFAAEGPILRIHDRHDSKLFSTLKVFSSQAIHGITVYASGIIVWGGRLVATYDFCRGPNLLERRSILEAIDWILDVSVSPESHKQKAALVTAHNALLLLDLEKTTQPGTELRELTSNSKCILYSAHLHWINDQQVLVASGTVFGDIIVWSCFLGGQTKDSFSTLHHVLMGHDGSIFGVQVFERPTVEGDESPSRLLATCSDDRTVRIWDISLLPDTATNPQAAADLTSTRETGFGINIADMLPDNPSGGRCIAKAWGHASRIWGVKFIPAATDVISYVVSFGEDATCQYWALTSLGIQQYSLSHLATSGSHSGKNIWSWAITRNAEHDFVIASGGADGSISLEPRTIPIVGASSRIQTWSIDDLASSCSQGSNSGRKDKLRSYAFLDHKDLLITTDAGNVLRLTQKERDHSKIELISTEPVLKGYSVVTSIPSLAIAFMSGMDGSVLMYDGTTVSQIVKSSGKSAGLFAQHFTAQAGHSRLGLLVTNVEAKTALFTCSDLTNDIDTALPLSNMFQWQLRLPKSFIITSSFAVPLDGSAHKIMLILGSRNGSIVSFLLDREGPQDTPIETALDGLIQNAHGTDAVTDLAWVAGTDAASDDGYLFSVGRDRAYTVHHLSRSEPAVKFRLVNRTYLSMGNNIEGLYVDKATGHVLVWGFHSKQFIVFDVTDETEIMTVDCGGANRSWVFEPGKGLQGGQFAWTKVSQLCLFSQRQRPRQALDKGGHGREIKAVAVSPNNPAGDGTLFATGAEDTDIKLFAYHRENKAPNFHCVRTLRKHNTGIQQLEWSSDGHYLFSSGGFEEFFVWKVEAAPLVGLGVACVSVCPTESAIPDLRIMGFSVSHDMYGFVITMARSDSTLRVWTVNHSRALYLYADSSRCTGTTLITITNGTY